MCDGSCQVATLSGAGSLAIFRRGANMGSKGAELRWAARVDDEPTATEGGDPSGTYKRWFGRASGRTGW